MIELKSPANGSEVCLQTDYQRDYWQSGEHRADSEEATTFCWYCLEQKGTDYTLPLPVSFSWQYFTDDEEEKNAYFYLLVSEKEDLSAPWVYITQNDSYDVYNLKVGTEYFWRVYRNGWQSELFSFKTSLTLPRCIKVDTISNIRDMGGYKVKDGRIRQGLAYRGSGLELHLHLAPTGAEEMLRLGIRTELDLRGEAKGRVEKTPGELIGLNRIFIPTLPYADAFKKGLRTSLGRMYRVFANPKNYRIYFHCWGGADRTGTLAFILGAFLGMDYEDLMYEYEFTTLSIWGVRARTQPLFSEFLKLFMALPGDTLQQKSISYLKDYAGLTDKQLCKIYEIMVEKEC